MKNIALAKSASQNSKVTTSTSKKLSGNPASGLAGVPHRAGTRLVSLDVLRGLTVAFMILVNTAGDGAVSYPQLRHSAWNGCTLTDLIFPAFLFIMGVSMALSFQGRLAKGTPPGRIALQVLKRSALMVGLGLLLNALPEFHLGTLRYMGVLQRIGICYLICGLLLLYLRNWMIVAIAVATTSGYWLLMTRVAVPGFGVPGVDMPLLDPHGNLASYVDRLLIPQAHLYHRGFYDPEGVLSTLPALATVLFGALTAMWIRRADLPASRRIAGLAFAAACFVTFGLIWGQSFPINKRLWTSSYVLFAAGIPMLLLAILIWAIDERRWLKKGLTPWLVLGTNALTAYVFSELLAILLGNISVAGAGTLQRYLYLCLPLWLGPPPLRSLIWSMLFVGVCFLPVWYLYRRKIFIKL